MPSVASQTPVLGRIAINGMLGAIFTRPAAALFNGGQVRLFTAGPTPITPDAVIGDFTEATFTGYAAQALATFTAVVNTPNNEAAAGTVNALFAGTAGLTPQTIQGYWIDDAVNVLVAEYFDTPIAISNPGDYIDLLVLVPVKYIPETGA